MLEGLLPRAEPSVERLQVRIIGADRDRYLVTCNGYPVPLLATDNPDVHVGGVRFRAWQPPSALHPSITVDGPLQFELVDLTTSTSRGGCTYHIAHPGGRAYDTSPVNAYEAEARRLARFQDHGHTAGTAAIPRDEATAEFPLTLDLRRATTAAVNPSVVYTPPPAQK